MGPEHFLPIAQDTAELGLNLLNKTDDPEQRKTCYGLFAALSTVLNDDMRNILPTIVEVMLDALKSMAGVLVSNGCAVSHVVNTRTSFTGTSNYLTNCRNILLC